MNSLLRIMVFNIAIRHIEFSRDRRAFTAIEWFRVHRKERLGRPTSAQHLVAFLAGISRMLNSEFSQQSSADP
ncbi:hypothetical protein WKW80_23150 [Variovorax humicola]|uniref:Uncharacterized protein n=1 Tax=Variovorax humicola TaxID=1769758 RepID=A0ABU8W4B2_9BURK